MSSITSYTTDTPLDCFETAIKLIMEASKIDSRCAAIVPKVAVAFSNAAKDANAKISLGTHIPPSVINSVPPPTVATYLVESIRVLSLCAPLFGPIVSELFLEIMGIMSPAPQSSGFASAEASAETGIVSAENDNAPKLLSPAAESSRDAFVGGKSNIVTVGKDMLQQSLSGLKDVGKELTKPGEEEESGAQMLRGSEAVEVDDVGMAPALVMVPDPSQQRGEEESDESGRAVVNESGRDVTAYKKMAAAQSPVVASPKATTNQEDDSNSESSSNNDEDSSVNESSSSESSSSSSSSNSSWQSQSEGGKRKEMVEIVEYQISDRIPKRQRTEPAKVYSMLMAPNNDNAMSYESNSFVSKWRFFSLKGDHMSRACPEEERRHAMNCALSQRDNIPMSVLLHRLKLWKKVLDYKPTDRCIPTDTYLVIAISCAGNDDQPHLLKKYNGDKDCGKDMMEFLSIKKLLLIPRPLGGDSMYYCISNLHKWQHGTLQMKSPQELWFKEATKHVDDLEVITPPTSYKNDVLGIEVFFKKSGIGGGATLRQLLPYLAQVMDPSCSTVRKVPFLSCGWTTANPNEYKNNRSNILGSIAPFLNDGRLKLLEQKQRKDLADLVSHLIESFSPLGIHPTPFFHSDPKIREMRKELALTFLNSLGISSNEINQKFFLAEGIGFVFNNFVPFHLDGMNDTASGMNETLAINCQCLINTELSGIPSVKKAMSFFNLSVGDPLSFSMVLYSRKVVGEYVKKQLKLKSITDCPDPANNPKLPDCWWLLKPLLGKIQEVDSDANTNAIWDNHSCLDKYMTRYQSNSEGNYYDGKLCSLEMGNDPTRHWSFAKYLFDAMEANRALGLNGWKRDDAVGYICFATLESSDPCVLSGIIDDVLCSKVPSQHMTMLEAKKYGMYAALIFAAHRKNHNLCNDMDNGCSKLCRHEHANKDTCAAFLSSEEDKKEISKRCQDVVKSIAEECQHLPGIMVDIGAKNRKDRANEEASLFVDRLKEIVGPGVSDDNVIDFVHLSCMIGLLPFDMIGWASIHSVSCRGYIGINALHKRAFVDQKGELPLEDARKHFNAAVKYICSNVSWNFTPAIAYNIIWNMVKEMRHNSEKDSPSRSDVLFCFKHRKGNMHHLYRWKIDSSSMAILQVLLVENLKKGGNVAGIYNLMEVPRDRIKSAGSGRYHSYFVNGDELGIRRYAKYIMSDKYKKYFA